MYEAMTLAMTEAMTMAPSMRKNSSKKSGNPFRETYVVSDNNIT